ncbi:MAG: hypothetical protein K2X87_13295 [Gemmataceae bacterium]|nr:hypothetical protein [Gemmataceae bacterium]
MATHLPPPDREEFARLGREVYDRVVKPKLRPEDDGKYVALDIRTGDYEIDEDDYAAVMRLIARCPREWTWLERAGFPAAYVIRRADGSAE